MLCPDVAEKQQAYVVLMKKKPKKSRPVRGFGLAWS